MIKVQYDEFMRHVPNGARASVDHWWSEPGTQALVYFDNPEPGHKGEASVLAVGPDRRVKRLSDVEGTHINELPELRQYPRFYCEKPAADTDH